MTVNRNRRPLSMAAMALLAGTALASPARAQDADTMRVEPGTVLEVSVVGIPDFRYKVPVNAGGEASFPLLEPFKVEGMTLAQVRKVLKERMPGKVYRQRVLDGRENFLSFSPEEITLDVAEYAPVYVNGDVSKPGAVVFRPGMTIRQAVALAGGFDLTRTRISNPFMEAADIRGEYDGAWVEFARQQAKVAGLRAMIDNKPLSDIRSAIKAPLAPSVLDGIATLEASQVKTSQQDNANELQHLAQMIKEADNQVDTLTRQLKTLEEIVSREQTDLDRIRGLYDKNVVPVNRLSDQQRQYALAQERVLAVTASMADASRLREDAKRKLQAAPDQRRIKLTSELQDATVKLEVLKGRITALDEKIVYTGLSKSQLTRGAGTDTTIVVHRRDASGNVEAIDLGEDAQLRAGDVVEVAVKVPVPGAAKAADASAR